MRVESVNVLLRNRTPRIGADTGPPPVDGCAHLEPGAIAVMRWLAAARVEYVLVGAVARAIRGERGALGPVAIVPAPYGRNLDRLVRALHGAHARERALHEVPGAADQMTREAGLRLTAALLVRPERWQLRCGEYELDIEGRPAGGPNYQELLYEAVRTEVAPELWVEVAAPEDVEFHDHVRRTGKVPEMVITRV